MATISLLRRLLPAMLLIASLPAQAATVTLFTDGLAGTPAGSGNGMAGDLRDAIRNATSGETIDFSCPAATCTITLSGPLPPIGTDLTIDGGNNIIIDGNGLWRAFFADTGIIAIRNLTIRNVRAKGGNGGSGGGGGGGGAGLGAGLFVNRSTAQVTVQNVVFQNASAVGGAGGNGNNSVVGGGGGGGLGGNGGGVNGNITGGGGGGVLGDGYDGTSITGGTGGMGGGGGGGGNIGAGGNGGAGYGSNTAGSAATNSGFIGGFGGFGGGGGGGYNSYEGGAGGVGAGGGSASTAGFSSSGAGGIGGGGGGGAPAAGAGGSLGAGIAGGAGGGGAGGGGGGAAAGPVIFVHLGQLTTALSTTTGQSATPGAGGTFVNSGNNGAAGTASSVAVFNYGGTVNGSATTGPLTSALYAPTYGLTATASGNGRVTSSTGGLDCPGTCSASIATITSGALTGVTLTATPAAGSSFTGWSGDCSGTAAAANVTMSAAHACTATFFTPAPPAPPPSFLLPGNPVPPAVDLPSGSAGSGRFSLAPYFLNPQTLTFAVGTLPSWLTFDPATATLLYTLPSSTLPMADGRAAGGNTIYPPLVRAAMVPIALTVAGGGQSYATTIQASVYAPRSALSIAAVSLGVDGAVGNGRSGRSALSWDGGQVVFETAATNLIAGSPNSQSDILRYHGLSGARDRLSQTAIPGGGVANAANGASTSPAVSSNGRYAAFASEAPGITLVPGRGVRQVYRANLAYPRVPLNETATPAPDLVSVTAAGVVGDGPSDNPVLSQDGRYVAFDSTATNLAAALDGARRVWRKDLVTAALDPVDAGSNPSISWDGRIIAFEKGAQIYLRDMAAASVRWVAVGSQPRLSARADRLAYVADGQVIVADVASGTPLAAKAGDQPSLSADGRFVAFRADGQVWVHDVDRGATALVSQTSTGAPGNAASWNPALSGDGSTIAFGSDARDLVNGNPAGGQAYIAANPLPLPARTGYWYTAAIGGGQGWVMERWGNKAYVGGLAYDGQGRSQWLAGPCTLSGLTCNGTLTNGPAFSIVTAADGAGASLTIGGAAAQALSVFPIGGSSVSGYAGLPQVGWWYEPGANDGIGYFFAVDTQGQADGSVAQVGYLSVLAYDGSGRPVWQVAQAPLGADLSFAGTLIQYAGGTPFGVTAPGASPSGSAVGPVRLVFGGTDRGIVTLPNGRAATVARFRF